MKKSTKRKSKGSKVNSSKLKFTEIVKNRPEFGDLLSFVALINYKPIILGEEEIDYLEIAASSWYDARAYLLSKYGVPEENINLTEHKSPEFDPDIVIRWEGHDYGSPNKHKVIWSRI